MQTIIISSHGTHHHTLHLHLHLHLHLLADASYQKTKTTLALPPHHFNHPSTLQPPHTTTHHSPPPTHDPHCQTNLPQNHSSHTKSLIKFTTISKPWNLTITSPHFTKSHLSTSLKNPLHPHHYLLHYSTRPHFSLHQTPLQTVINCPGTISKAMTHPMQCPDKSSWLVGSINGLVCVAFDENELILWNPCLRKHRRVPRVNVEAKRGCFLLYGFAYDNVGDDYKVVALLCLFSNVDVFENVVMVYSAKSDRWKKIDGFKDCVPLNDSGKFVNGKVHWATNTGLKLDSGRRCNWSIVFVDVGDESSGELDQPDYGEGKYNLVLGVMGEWICVLCDDGENHLDFWVMKEYGVSESWTKFASISCLNGPRTAVLGIYEPPLCLLNDDGNIFDV
ncbi:hypothetical protein Leryth_001866 [Lithospermum erythrorhizon]|nr:hypothetical protein Leryth_001866 [Lithospermum erythrorhizon]